MLIFIISNGTFTCNKWKQ